MRRSRVFAPATSRRWPTLLRGAGAVCAGGAGVGGRGRARRQPAGRQRLAERMLAEAARPDAEEDERLGDARGDELPAELVDPRSRRERLRRCKEELEREQADEQAAYEANLAWRAVWEAEHGRRL